MNGTPGPVTDSAPAAPLPAPFPKPPSGVPVTAVWVDAEGEWQVRRLDADGNLHGAFRSWRADGTPRTICSYEHGKEVGAVWKFHPDGSLFSLGCFAAGVPRGVHRRYGNNDPNSERLQSCCVPPGAWTLREEHPRPNFIDRGWFNRNGERLLESGLLHPVRPATVPEEAWYNENALEWQAGVVFDEIGLTGIRRCWSAEGVLKAVEGLQRGQRHGQVQLFDDRGILLWQAHYLEGRLSGPFFATGLSPGHFADANAYSQSGSYLNDQAEGVWRTLDAKGAIIQERDLGRVLDATEGDIDRGSVSSDAALPGTLPRSPVFANQHRTADAWRGVAQGLFAARRVGEGLVAAARASAQANDLSDIIAALRAHTLTLGRDAALDEARRGRERTSAEGGVPPSQAPVILIDTLKRGGDPATTLWALAQAVPENDLLALDLVNAALLVDPAATDALTTRTLLLAGLGQLQAARADVARLSAVSPDQGAFLDLYLRIYFPRFTFWPAAESLPEIPPDVLLQPTRTLAEVRDLIQRYATRLQRLRQALLRRLAAAGEAAGAVASTGVEAASPFMIPDLSGLLPDGPVPLSRWTFQMSAAEYGGDPGTANDDATDHDAAPNAAALGGVGPTDDPPSSVEIVVDETEDVEPTPTAILQILRRARADWSGLVWLCWAVGLDTAALPSVVRARADFASAAVMTMERTWRCRDKLRTSGLLALTKGIPGFEWEGTSIDLVPSALVDVALEDYLEARAVFSWLCDPANRSPWQDDLRNTDD